MAPKQPNGVQLVFLPPNNRSGDGLDSTARGHASRQGHSRSAKKRAATGPAQVRGRKPVGGGSGPGHVAGRYLEKHDQYCCCSGCSGQDGRDVDQSALIGVQKVKIYDKQRRMQHAASPARLVVDRDIGSGDLDPFNTSTVAGLSSSERYLLHYALTATTGSFGESPEIKRNFAHSWTCRSLENMSTLHANVLGGSVHYLLNCPDLMPAHQIRAVSLAAKGRALQNLRAEIDLYYRRPDAVNADNLLLTIFVLGIHADVVPGPAPSRPRWSSPLADCRDLGVYSRMCFGSEHMEAMYTLIEERGGVKNICNTTFGCVIPLTDMLYSFRQGVTPRLPSHYTVQQIRDTEVWRPDAEANLMLATLGSAFRKDSGALPLILQLGPEITETLLTLAEITAAVDQYVRGGTGAPDTLDVLLNNIDWASHRLLSQPSYLAQIKGKKKKKGSIKEKGKSGDVKTTGLGSRRPVLRELCRLASLLYLNMVMLPYGPHGEVRHRISRQVLDLLVSDDGPLSWANRGDGGGDDEDDGGNQGPVWDFLLWVACLGAVSGQGTPLEEKYAGFLRDHGRLRMGWAAARERVKRFLWWDHVCEEPALLMWADAAGELS